MGRILLCLIIVGASFSSGQDKQLPVPDSGSRELADNFPKPAKIEIEGKKRPDRTPQPGFLFSDLQVACNETITRSPFRMKRLQTKPQFVRITLLK
jgi:hypothetical protein